MEIDNRLNDCQAHFGADQSGTFDIWGARMRHEGIRTVLGCVY
jgi:hypothetical protein